MSKRAVKKVCFTGHRPKKLGGYASNPVSYWVKQSLRKAIERAIKKGVKTFISGGGLGVDQWAAQIVIDIRAEQMKSSTLGYGIELVIVRPFPSQASRWPQASRRHYDKILQKADRIIEVCEYPYAAWKMQKRNEWMVDNADCVIAVWDGTAGGTAHCVQYAMKQEKAILVIDAKKQSEKWIIDGKMV